MFLLEDHVAQQALLVTTRSYHYAIFEEHGNDAMEGKANSFDGGSVLTSTCTMKVPATVLVTTPVWRSKKSC